MWIFVPGGIIMFVRKSDLYVRIKLYLGTGFGTNK